MVTQIEVIQRDLKEAGLSEEFGVKDYGGGGWSVTYHDDGTEVTFASNMGIAQPGVIFHYTGKPEVFNDEKTNQTIRTIINKSFPEGPYEKIPDESLF